MRSGRLSRAPCCRQEDLGWEENPPTLARIRAPRSGAGLPGAKHASIGVFPLALLASRPVSRYQAGAGDPDVSSALRPGSVFCSYSARSASHSPMRPLASIRADAGMALLVCVLVMWFSPKDRERHRHFDAAGASPRIWRRQTVHRQLRPSKPCTRSLLCSDPVGFGHTILPPPDFLFGREIGWIGADP